MNTGWQYLRKAYGKPRVQVDEAIQEGWGLMEKNKEDDDEDDDGPEPLFAKDIFEAEMGR